MAPRKLHFKIILPDEVKVDEWVDMVIMRCPDGDLGIMAKHQDYLAVVDYGKVRIINNDKERWIAVYGGLALMVNNVLTILSDEAQWPQEIDFASAQAERELIQQRLLEESDDREIQNDQILLRRALVQMEVSNAAFSEVAVDEGLS